jgi:hypothetical protein
LPSEQSARELVNIYRDVVGFVAVLRLLMDEGGRGRCLSVTFPFDIFLGQVSGRQIPETP